MAKLRRMEQAGAIFSESLDSIESLQKRGFLVTGNPTITDGPLGKALDFDGTNDYVTLGSDWEERLRFDGSTQDFSISCWVNKDSSSNDVLVDKTDADNDGWSIFIKSDDGIRASVNSVNANSSGTLTNGKWHHVAVTFDRDGNMQIYIDGTADGSGSINGQTLATTIQPVIGAVAYNFSSKIAGAIKDLMIFDRVLTATEVSNLAQNKPFDYEKNVVSEWDMSDINPPDVGWKNLGNDATNTGLDGTNIVNGIAGGKALEFNGTNEQLTMNGVAGDIDVANGAVSFWLAKSVEAAGNQWIVATREDSSNYRGLLRIGNSSNIQFIDFATSINLNIVATVDELDKWNHIVLDWNSDGMELFVNGVSLGSDSGTPASLSLVDFTVAAWGTSFRTAMVADKLIVFDRALTQMEISDLYQKQRGGKR